VPPPPLSEHRITEAEWHGLVHALDRIDVLQSALSEHSAETTGWARVEDAAVGANFWMLDERGGVQGLDGAEWLIA
jgi:hypothetical protein